MYINVDIYGCEELPVSLPVVCVCMYLCVSICCVYVRMGFSLGFCLKIVLIFQTSRVTFIKNGAHICRSDVYSGCLDSISMLIRFGTSPH